MAESGRLCRLHVRVRAVCFSLCSDRVADRRSFFTTLKIMDSHKSEAIANREKAEKILHQIQSLKNQLPDAYQSFVDVQHLSPKRKADSDKTAVLIAGSPSPSEF